jgi:hypothetical protein
MFPADHLNDAAFAATPATITAANMSSFFILYFSFLSA